MEITNYLFLKKTTRITSRIYLYLVLSIFCFQSNWSIAQSKENRQDRAIIQLYDGSVFIGQIIEEAGLNLKIIIVTKDTILLNKAFIHRIRRTDEDVLIHPGGKFHFTKGAFYSLQFGGSLNDNNVGDGSGQFDFTLGYRFNKKYSAGLGIGFYDNTTIFGGNWIQTSSVPLFAYGRFYPFDKKVRPYVDARFGWGFPNRNAFGGEHSGGMFIQPGIGVNFASRRNMRFLIGLSQLVQHISGEETAFGPLGNPINSKFSIWFNRTVLKIGFEWK